MIEYEGALGFVLAGGQSRRMGRDKALLSFGGQPLIERALEILKQAGLSAAIAGERSDLAAYGSIVEDSVHGQGPLAGVCAALESMKGRWGVFLPVDVPLVPAALLMHLLRLAQESQSAVVIASIAGEAQTFPAVIDRGALPTLREELNAGRRKCFRAFETAAAANGGQLTVVPVEPLAVNGTIAHPAGLDAVYWFLNVNTPDQLTLAESLDQKPF